MKKYLILTTFVLTGITMFTGCGPEVPAEAEIRTMIVGVYCDGDYRLELTDSTYMNRKFVQSPLRSGMVREACNGNYSIVYENDSWILRFEADDSPGNSLFNNCKQDVVVWNKTDLFLMGTEPITMKDLFDGVVLTKDACDDL
ncbi:MAG: hypothetical protein SF052_11800 [Bacteroidia bacterium]|nr:hypothetical protein [Bacteroidia bacterium]